MKKKLASLMLATVLCTGLVMPLSGCLQNDGAEGETTRMTVNINPSIELMVDGENKVISATALNDDGSVILAGEAMVGKTSEEAVELIVSISCEAGYLVQGNVTADENTVSVSVSGNAQAAAALYEKAAEKVQSALDKAGVTGKVERAQALALEELRKIAAECCDYTEEELNAMTEEELCRAIAVSRLETATLPTEALREAYYKAKDYEISFAEREETAKVIQAMGGLHTLVYNGYKAVLDVYGTAIDNLDQLRYDLLVSPDSAYQKSLASLRAAKADLLKQKQIVASLDVNGTEYASAVITLQLSEEAYEKALALYEQLGESANAALESAVAALRGYEAQLAALEENFSKDVQAELTAKAQELEDALNERKNAFLDDFAAKHKDDIDKAEAELIARKQALIEAIQN